MNRHTKIAIFVAPILLLGGYIASDYYLEHQAAQNRVFQLVPEGHCDVINEKCVLKAGDFKINVFDRRGSTSVNSTFPIDRAAFFIVDSEQEVESYQLAMGETPYYWSRLTTLRERIANKGAKQKLRVIIEIKGGKYISEFYTQTVR
ncbi:MAG: hypothetical protein MK214_01770 [Thalassotalea sp.]|nr:hypothetical protein [Thalassotalea sp.]